MCADEENQDSFEDMVRSMAEELGRSVEHMIDQVDVEEVAEAIGVDPMRAREWMDTASGWLRARAESFGEEMAGRSRPAERARPEEPRPAEAHPYRERPASSHTQPDDPLSHAGPHPLDMPTDEQGLALAALESGRWIVEPGSNALAAKGEGPGPSDALGLVRELRSRDWIRSDGEVTPAGRHALTRWLEASGAR